MFKKIQAAQKQKLLYGLEGIWISEHRGLNSRDFEVLPDAHCDIIIEYSNSHSSIKDIWITGFEKHTRIKTIDPGISFMGLQFLPGALSKLPIAEIGNQAIALSSIESKISISLKASFAKFLETGNLIPIYQWIENQIQRPDSDLLSTAFYLKSKENSCNPSELAVRRNISLRTLERKFKKLTGLTPGEMIKILRFHKSWEIAMDQYLTHNKLHLANIAIDAGFSDQSHLSREIKSFTGKSAKDFFYNSVAFIQDKKLT